MFGVYVPLKVEYALRIHQENYNTIWNDYIEKEIKDYRVAFNLLDRDDHATVVYREITCHQIFMLKLTLTGKLDNWLEGI